jgi:uncharacterized SAM-binding protein YcdF (DUF218 family)
MRGLVSYGVLAPPNIFIVLCLAGALIALVWRRIGIAIMLASSICLFVTATPVFSSLLTDYLESQTPRDTNLSSAEAIVILGADVRLGEGQDRLGLQSLDRIVMGAEAYRRLGLPVAVSGGRILGWNTSVAALMKAALIRDFGVPVTWMEDSSRTTYENAVYTAQLLRQANIGTVVVIAQACDLPRAIWSFERAGLHALPWPAPRRTRFMVVFSQIDDFLPTTTALNQSFHALHELIGGLYYRLRY